LLDVRRGGASRSSRYGAVSRERRLVDQNIASWNQLLPWLRRLDFLRGAQLLAV